MLGNSVANLRRWGVSWRTILMCALGFHGPKRRLWMGYCPRCGRTVVPVPHVTCYACKGVQEHHDRYPRCDYCGEPDGLLSAVEMLQPLHTERPTLRQLADASDFMKQRSGLRNREEAP